ncbi:LARGE xylosyl- and glucuronyltransferase 2 [Eurytemora carolleeae]|uniref:LARGE xylosyl- and glucuronyltransferase 2 n=1 Tax=Eurytemora carolleeae TaxID=1294199 RepID=UPI000C76F914|nr:LARGE xylosyl- and glucuronyltransferase 2 [Eurytemora carolleeae]|eukprot:XP_023334739.1 LARGE xylosyl- and glucuronyltransferase 2-like [Eurytemora affinis]
MMRLTRAPARLIAYGLVVLSLLLLAYSQKFVEIPMSRIDYFFLNEVKPESSRTEELNLICILCQSSNIELGSDLTRQIRQASVMLKSAVMFSQKLLHFHILADNSNLYSRLVNMTLGWPEIYKRKLRFSMHPVWYPEGRDDMRVLFRECATERLFVPDIFPNIEKAIYLDTDLIFLRPVEHLWDEFNNFNQNQISAMSPCLYHYGSERNKIPFFGETGLNAGIMHMHLKRMRNMDGGWTNANLAMFEKYKDQISLADQDILNILFHFHPEKIYELPCHWNYRVWQCSQGENKCTSATDQGVSILHGNALTFVKFNHRETWGNPNIPGVNTRLVFLLGMVSDVAKQNSVKKEAMQYKDIVQGDFLDTYRNLSYKNVFGKLWVSNFCEQADFVVKTDDDMFVDLYATYFFTRQYLVSPEYNDNSFLLCPMWPPTRILRDKKRKWYVSYDEISKKEGGDLYPPYCSGYFYILNPGTSARLVVAAQTTKFLWIDDAWVTGYIAKKLKIKQLDIKLLLKRKMKDGLMIKSIQTPEIYHKDILATPNGRNLEISQTLNKHAYWCYIHQCFNNIYHPSTNISNTKDVIEDGVLSK